MAESRYTPEQIAEAEQFLADFVQQEIPAGDFSEGSVLRDLAIQAIALAFVYLQDENAKTRALSRIEDIARIEDDTERDEAVDGFTSNMFLNRLIGGYSRGTLEVLFSEQHTGTVSVGTKFFSTTGLLFTYSGSSALIYDESSLLPVTLSAAVYYKLLIPVIAGAVGEEYNIGPQDFPRYDRFSPFIVSITSLDKFIGGKPQESSEDFLARIPDAITVRNLLTNRALNTVLPDTFPSIRRLLNIGYGDPEMTRDLAPLALGGTRIHMGGAVDSYVDTGLSERTIERIVGNVSYDESGVRNLFVDLDFYLRQIDWRGYCRPGDILRHANAGADESNLFVIEEVDSTFLRVQPLMPFKELKPTSLHNAQSYEDSTFNATTKTLTVDADASLFTQLNVGHYVYMRTATDVAYRRITAVANFNADGFASEITVEDPYGELVAFPTTGVDVRVYDDIVSYSVGNNYPNYDNLIALRDFGQITDQIETPGSILMPAEPIYRVKEVVLLVPDDPAADPLVGGIPFTNRINEEPAVVDPAAPTDYRVVSLRPAYAQSTAAGTRLQIGPIDGRSGTDGSLSPTGDETATFTVGDSTFTIEDEGKSILIEQASNIANAGVYEIITYNSTTSVEVRHDGALLPTPVLVAEAQLPWSIDTRSRYDGEILRVTYDTLPGFSTIAEYVQGDEQRTLSASGYVRGFHPVYLSFTLLYQRKNTATETLDQTIAVAELVAFINSFDVNDTLNVNDIVTQLRTLYPTIIGNVILPITVSYELLSPTGDVVQFASTDVISVDTAYAASPDDEALLDIAKSFGVSDRTIRYLTASDLITLTRV